MSSARYPGKMLAPFRGRPLIWNVLAGLRKALPKTKLVLATSEDPTDDPLAVYAESLKGEMKVETFRGALSDVVARFKSCLRRHPCEWFLRICADGPLPDGRTVRKVVASAGPSCDLVTTTFPRSFPVGQNMELIRSETFLGLDDAKFSREEREHPTSYYYHHPELFRIVNIDSGDKTLAQKSFAVDSLEDLKQLEALSPKDIPGYDDGP